MSEIIDFLKGLFETTLWPPRWHCGYWSDFQGWMYIISDLLIWIAYFLIPAIILDYFIKRKKAIKFQKIYLLFAAFILLCGTTHFLDAVMFWVPMYRLNTLVRALTAVVSILTAIYLVRVLPEVFRQQTNLELEKEISRRKEAEMNLQKANENLEAFAFVASHDLQHPLRKILLYSSMLLDSNESDPDTKSKELIKKINSSAERLKGMTAAILELSALKNEPRMTMTPLAESVNLALTDLEEIIQNKGAQITVGKLPEVYGNVAYLSQLFLNLIGNAIKFSERVPTIKIDAEQSAPSSVLIRIADNGIGISAGDKEKIFSVFTRSGNASQYEGSGIGLAICQRIVDIHHGKIHVESILGEGSVFLIELPIKYVATEWLGVPEAS